MLLLPLSLFIVGLVLLLLAGDILTELTLTLARKLGLLPITIALTITALATSMPEVFISAIAALEGQPALALGNVAGSNIANHWLVLGLAALFAPLVATAPFIRRNNFFALGATLLVVMMSAWDGIISRLDGVLLLGAAAAWFFYILKAGRNHAPVEEPAAELHYQWLRPITARVDLSLLACGATVLGLAIGARLTLAGAEGMAVSLSVPDAVIGLTALAVGTSLPELATSLAAARRKQTSIILGNLLGSTVLNCFVVLGVASLLYPIPASEAFIYRHFPIAALACLSLLPFALLKVNPAVKTGLLFLALYGGYSIILFAAN